MVTRPSRPEITSTRPDQLWGVNVHSMPARWLWAMDFRRPRPGKPGGIRYLFDCGAFSDASLAGIVVQPEEIAEYRVADLRTALTMLRKPIRLRVRAATRGHALRYLENGRPVPGVGARRRGRCTASP